MNLITLMFAVVGYLNTSSIQENEMNKIIVSDESEECFDELMFTWFIEFHKQQEEGLTMDDADRNASNKAVNLYKTCQ